MNDDLDMRRDDKSVSPLQEEANTHNSRDETVEQQEVVIIDSCFCY